MADQLYPRCSHDPHGDIVGAENRPHNLAGGACWCDPLLPRVVPCEECRKENELEEP